MSRLCGAKALRDVTLPRAPKSGTFPTPRWFGVLPLGRVWITERLPILAVLLKATYPETMRAHAISGDRAPSPPGDSLQPPADEPRRSA